GFVRKVEKEFGAVDALINCAGPYHRVNILDETPAGWTAMFAHNLHAVFYMSKAVTPGMKARKSGRIISFSMANADQMVAQRRLGHLILPYCSALGRTRLRYPSCADSRSETVTGGCFQL